MAEQYTDLEADAVESAVAKGAIYIGTDTEHGVYLIFVPGDKWIVSKRQSLAETIEDILEDWDESEAPNDEDLARLSAIRDGLLAEATRIDAAINRPRAADAP